MKNAERDLRYLLGSISQDRLKNLWYHYRAGTIPLVGVRQAATKSRWNGMVDVVAMTLHHNPNYPSGSVIEKEADRLGVILESDNRMSLGQLLVSISESELWSSLKDEMSYRGLLEREVGDTSGRIDCRS